MEQRIWTIPAARMKAGKEHRVPFSEPAMAILRASASLKTGDRVFPSGYARATLLADVTLKEVLRRLGHEDVTVHGMSSTFRDWCADKGKPADVAEMVLAHTVGSAVVRAYQRSDLLDAKRRLMDQWSEYLTQPPAVVVPLRVAG